MADYDNKLGEWFQQVEKSAQAIKAKKDTPAAEPRETAQIERREAQETVPAAQPTASAVATMENGNNASRPLRAVATRGIRNRHPAPGECSRGQQPLLFDDSDIPSVEDFFSFLSRSEESATEEPVVEVSRDQRLLNLSEGTGEPRPIAPKPQPPVPGSEGRGPCLSRR